MRNYKEKEVIVRYGLVSRKRNIKSYYNGLNQVLDKIKEEQIQEPIILYTNQGSVYSSTTYNNLLKEFNIPKLNESSWNTNG